MSLRLIGTRLWRYQKDTIGSPPYMTRRTFGRFRYHIFHRGDQDKDPHDHQWDFVTFPLTSYVEEYLTSDNILRRQIVKRFRFHKRAATYRHRVLGKWCGIVVRRSDSKPEALAEIIAGDVHTLVFVSRKKRDWGFHVDFGRCFVPWRDYVFGEKRGCD